MTIAIVPAFIKQPIPTAANERTADGAAPVDDARDGVDFASILLALPPVPGTQPVRDKDALPPDDPVVDAASQPADDSQFLATLGLPPLHQPAESPGNARAEAVPTRRAASNTLMSAEPTTIDRQLPVQVGVQPGADRRPTTSEAFVADDTPAKFAVADFAAPVSERTAPVTERSLSSKPETVALASGLDTLVIPPNNALNGAALVTHDNHAGLQTPLRDPAWAGEFGQKLLWFVSNEKQLAQLTVHPPQLGSIEITLNMDKGKDSTSAYFVSPSADVRGAIEAAVPRLREMFASAGIQLGQVNIGSESFQQPSNSQQQPAYPQHQPSDNAILGIDSAASGLASQPVAMRRGQGLIDIFA